MDLIEELRAREELPPPPRRREIRESAGVSAYRVAKQLNISHSTVLGWEAGRNTPSASLLVPYVRLLAELEALASR